MQTIIFQTLYVAIYIYIWKVKLMNPYPLDIIIACDS